MPLPSRPLAFGGLCVAGVAAAIAAADRADNAASSPIHPPGHWRVVLIAGLALALVAYVLGVLSLRNARGPVAAVLAVAAAVQLAPLAGPTLLSTDVYTYWMYGRIGAVHDGNPYSDPPSAYPNDPAYTKMGSSWRNTTSLYGPLFTLGSEGEAKLAGDDGDRAAQLSRLAAAVAMLAAVAAAAALAKRPAFGAAFVGWNPLLALHFAGGGHNDAPMMALVLVALLLADRGYPNLAGGAWAAAIAIKWVPVAFLALWLLYRRRRGLPLGIPGLAAGGAILVALATLAFGSAWLHAFKGLSGQARRTGSIGLSQWLGDLGLGHRQRLAVIALFLLVAFALLAWWALRRRLRLGVAGSALAFGQGWLNPWYASWGVSLSATDDDRLAQLLAVVLSAFLLRDAIPI